MKQRPLITLLLTAALPACLTMSLASRLMRGCYASDLALSGQHQHRYTMNAGVRFIPWFWISKNNVGGGKISWSEEADGTKAMALLIGSEPSRAPRKINRWGYVIERVSGSKTELTGIMSQSDEKSIDQAETSTAKSANRYAFKGIRSRIEGLEAQSSTFQMYVAENYTYKDAAVLLEQMPMAGKTVRHLRIPSEAASGFLFTVHEMLRETAERYKQSGRLIASKPRQYVYNAVLFNLSMDNCDNVKSLSINGREYKQLIESNFKARNSANGKTTRFTITYSSDTACLDAPVRILYQPRWWFRVELLLDESRVEPR